MKLPELRSIMLVDDDLQLRLAAQMALEVIGRFAVRTCGSGQAALRAGADFRPDLIMLDAGADGMATLQLLRKLPHLARTPAMLMGALASIDTLAGYRQFGAIGVLPKPLAPLRLTDQLRTVWERRQAVV